MLFQKKISDTRIRPRPYGITGQVWRALQARTDSRWSLRLLYLLLFVALFGNFIANDHPLYCRFEGKTYFPAFREVAIGWGMSQWYEGMARTDWKNLDYERVWWPPVPYAAHTIDRNNMNYRGPLERQEIPGNRFRHWLGTDSLGRDVLAGMIQGTRIALSVGLVAMAIAGLIGLLLGLIAGYFGDGGLRVSRARLLASLAFLILGIFYGFTARPFAFREGHFGLELAKSLGILLLALTIAQLLAPLLKRIPVLAKKMAFPIDSLVMRTIETLNAIPVLLLILAVVATIRRPSIYYIMLIIGLISWTGIARFTRAEVLRIRRLSYVEAARALGYSRTRILLGHVLPNALSPAIITLAFGMAGAILLEAFLSFLGIGVDPQTVTWGSLLNLARSNVSAWWLALFPGLAIFATVTIFNLLGDRLSEALKR
ncbi:MAG: ABC transporter permease [Saprospiraceae bacterium]|nr:ABC transporter permease [Saprospiraceae bacterium]